MLDIDGVATMHDNENDNVIEKIKAGQEYGDA